MKTRSDARSQKKSPFRTVLRILGALLLAMVLFALTANLVAVLGTKDRVLEPETVQAAMEDPDCILILGAGVWEGGRPSPILSDRLDEGLKLYQAGLAKKILVSGDHGREGYDEVNVMKSYLIERGVPGEDVFMDHAGFSTYESVYRAKAVFGVRRMIVVTQRYHLYRALYVADRLGIEAVGVHADPRRYAGAALREAREVAGRIKDALICIFKPEPTFLGDPVDIHGNGNVTND